jgi:hypothetical protein
MDNLILTCEKKSPENREKYPFHARDIYPDRAQDAIFIPEATIT